MMQASDTLYIVTLSLLSLAPDIIMDEERETHMNRHHTPAHEAWKRGEGFKGFGEERGSEAATQTEIGTHHPCRYNSHERR